MTARRHNSGTGPIAVIMQSIRANRQSIWVSTAHRTPDENNVSHGNIQGRSFCGAVGSRRGCLCHDLLECWLAIPRVAVCGVP